MNTFEHGTCITFGKFWVLIDPDRRQSITVIAVDDHWSINIAKSEQSSHTLGGSHHRRLRSYHFNFFSFFAGSAVAWWLMPRTPDPEVGGSSPTRVKPCCVLEQGIFTPQKVLVIPGKRWLRPNMTENLFSGTLRINQP